jgi:hypothetical protein
MEHVYFKPWVGKDYQTGGIFNKRILAVGEGHVCGGKCQNECGIKYSSECEELTTTIVVNDYLNGCGGKWTSTYRKFERSLVNKETTLEDSKIIWQSIAFFNFLQVAITESRKAGTNEDYKESQTAFLEVIDELLPELIIIWGVGRLFYNLPEERWVEGSPLVIDDYHVKNGYYQLKNGEKSRCIAVYHPSTGYSWDWWYKVISSQI